MRIDIDGDKFFIVGDDFINLQESPVVWLEKSINDMDEEELHFISDKLMGLKGCDNWGEQSPGIFSGCKECLFCRCHSED